MKVLAALVALLAVADAKFKPGLLTKFDVGLTPWEGKDYFVPQPRTKAAAVKAGWVLVSNPDIPYSKYVELYCPSTSDVVRCVFYDKDTGIEAGLNIAIEGMTDNVFDLDVQGWIPWTPIGTQYRTKQVYFNSLEHFKKSPAERTASYDSKKFLQNGGFWVSGFNGELDFISENQNEVEKNSLYTKQACIPWMGRHYYWNMSPKTPCRPDTIFSWFALCHSGQTVGVGLMYFGKLQKDPKYNKFEQPPTLAVKGIINNGPQCIYDIVDKYGVRTMHIYIISEPWGMGCLSN